VEATTNYRDPAIVAKVSRGLGTPMVGIEMDDLETRLADRGW
jgi:pyridoxal 5'-phosphate synthase pdxS subunit